MKIKINWLNVTEANPLYTYGACVILTTVSRCQHKLWSSALSDEQGRFRLLTPTELYTLGSPSDPAGRPLLGLGDMKKIY